MSAEMTAEELGYLASLQAAEVGTQAWMAEHSAPNSDASDKPTGTSCDMPLAWLTPSTYNPRRTFDQESLQQLADSIQQHGLLEPIVVREIHPPADWSVRVVDQDGTTCPTYEVVAGERRYRACRLLQLQTVPVRVLEGVDDKRALQIAIIENLQRVDLDPLEEARGYAALRDQAGMTQTAIAAAVKRSQPAIAKALGLLKLPDEVQEMLQTGQITSAHAAALERFADFPAYTSAVAKETVAYEWTSKRLAAEKCPTTYQMQQQGLVEHVGYDTKFDKKICHACPFNAYRAGNSRDDGICLKPSHYKELQKAAKAAAADELGRKIKDPVSQGMVSLRSLPYDSYVQLGDKPPAGCTVGCACRGQALAYGEQIVTICTKPACFKKLQTAETKAKHKAYRDEAAALVAAQTAHILGSPEITSDMLAALVFTLLLGRKGDEVRAVATRHGVTWLPATSGAQTLEHIDLLALTPLQLVAFGLDLYLSSTLESAIDNTYVNTAPARWYAQYRNLTPITAQKEKASE